MIGNFLRISKIRILEFFVQLSTLFISRLFVRSVELQKLDEGKKV